mgnify:CR=1 FL=1
MDLIDYLMAAKIERIIAIVGIRCRNYAYRCLLVYGVAVVRSLSFLFINDFEGNAKISIRSGSAVHITEYVSKNKQQRILILVETVPRLYVTVEPVRSKL